MEQVKENKLCQSVRYKEKRQNPVWTNSKPEKEKSLSAFFLHGFNERRP
jgi:hypothetical protein